ncbi:glycosyltransferase [Clostridioides sp. ZZV14-6045]|uniref:glycosyltransferase n=1 Tax=Clostridioides sp. ZZV14-6045 TaxID=2811489 RepID=UPI001D0F6EDD|nr:glycosyltransferase [Clostridioides sp. ZZV14-6045]
MIIDIVLCYAQGIGGLEVVLTNVSNELVKRGYKVRIFLAYKPKYTKWLETLPEVYFYSLKEDIDDSDINDLVLGYKNMLLEMEKPDIIIATHAPTLSYVCKESVKFLGEARPVIVSWLHSVPEYFGGEEYLNYSDSYLAISHYIGKQIKKYIDKGKEVYYVGNPVDTTSFNTVKQSKEKFKILFVGRLSNHEKRLDVLFKALSLLDKDWELNIFGRGQDEGELRNLAMKLNIYGNINWLGWVENPWESIDSATVLVLTSDFEGFAMVLIEALGRGIPVISSDCSGSTDIIESNKNGWMFKKGDYEQLYIILKNIQSKMNALPNSDDCVKSVEMFSVNNVVDKIESALLESYKNFKNKIKTTNLIENIKILIENGDFHSASKMIDMYIDLYGYDLDLYCMKGIVSLQQNNLNDAYNNFKLALDIENNNVDVLYNMAYTCLLKENNEESKYYYKECLNNSIEDDLNTEIENLLQDLYNNNYYEESNDKTFITINMDKDNFIFRKLLEDKKNIINIIYNDSIKCERFYLENGISTYETDSERYKNLIEYLARKNKSAIFISSDYNQLVEFRYLREYIKLAYYCNKNLYTKESDYLNQSSYMDIEMKACNLVDLIITDDIEVYILKKIVEYRKNVYFFINTNIESMRKIDLTYLIEDNSCFYIVNVLENYFSISDEELNDNFMMLSDSIYDEYKKAFYLIALNQKDIHKISEISSYIYNKYNSEVIYIIYLYLLTQINETDVLKNTIINSKYCEEIYGYELLYVDFMNDVDTMNFIVNLSIKNYTYIYNNLNKYDFYKRANYKFALNLFNESYNEYIKLFEEDTPLKNSPMVSRNIAYIKYMNGEKYNYFYEKYKSLVK